MAVPGEQATRGIKAGRFDVVAALASPWALAVIVALGVVPYLPTLSDWFRADDFWFLRASQQHGVLDEIRRSFDYRNVGDSIEFDRYRPLYPIAWRLQYELFGTEAFGYRLIVLAMHAGCIACVWAIAARLSNRTWAPAVAAFVFAIHPAYTDAVAWLSGGNRVYSTLPYLLAMLAYMRAGDGAGIRRAVWYAGSAVLFLIAVLFHTSALTLPAVLVAYEVLLRPPPPPLRSVGRWLPLAPFLLVAAAMALLQLHVRSDVPAGSESFRFGYHVYANEGDFFGRLATALQKDYLTSISGPARAASGAGSVALIGLMVALIVAPRWRLGAFAALFVILAPLPDTTFALGASGRAMYLPAAAFAILVVAALEHVEDFVQSRNFRFEPLLLGVAACVTIPALALSYYYTTTYSDDGAENERFIAGLHRDVAALPPGTLYVIDAPLNLRLFESSIELDAAVELRYGEDGDVRAVPKEMEDEVRETLGSDDVLYRYEP